MQNTLNTQNDMSSFMMTNSLYIITTKLHDIFNSLVKFFHNDISNLIVQYIILKIISGIPFDIIIKEIKNGIITFYNKNFKSKIDYILPTQINFSFSIAESSYHETYTSLKKQWVSIPVEAILWKINMQKQNINHMIHIPHTKITGDDGVFIPITLNWYKLDENIYVDIYSEDIILAGSKMGHWCVLCIKSYVLNHTELIKYIENIVKDYNKFIGTTTLGIQKIFTKKNNIQSQLQQSQLQLQLQSQLQSQLQQSQLQQSQLQSQQHKYLPNPYEFDMEPLEFPNQKLNNNCNIDIGWTMKNYNSVKTWDTFFIEDKERIREVLIQTLKNNNIDSIRIGRPSKKIILAHGPSRCGKNSLFKILTKEFEEKHLIYLQPGTIKSFSDFEIIKDNEKIMDVIVPHDKRIYQFDEVDKNIKALTISNEKNNDNDNDKNSCELSKWLTYFDGADEDNDKIIFMTSETIDKFHPSFLKRVRLIEVKKATKQMVIDIITLYYKYDGNDKNINDMFNKFEDYKYTPSSVYDACEYNCIDYDSNNIYKYIINTIKTLLDNNDL